MTFQEWLRPYAPRNDKYGDVAGEVVHDPAWRDDIATREDMDDYLAELQVASAFHDVLLELFDAYLNEETIP